MKLNIDNIFKELLFQQRNANENIYYLTFSKLNALRFSVINAEVRSFVTYRVMDNLINTVKDYEVTYKTFFNKFYNYGKKFTIDTSLIEDSIQEVFLDIWKKRKPNQAVEFSKSYYFAAFHYTLFRKIKNKAKFENVLDYVEPEFSAEKKIISKEISEEKRKKIQQALQSLTSRQREAIFLRFYEGLSYEEVAEVLNISVKATYKIIARSLSSLKKNFRTSLLVEVLVLYVLKTKS